MGYILAEQCRRRDAMNRVFTEVIIFWKKFRCFIATQFMFKNFMDLTTPKVSYELDGLGKNTFDSKGVAY
jgi:hypothetical protein